MVETEVVEDVAVGEVAGEVVEEVVGEVEEEADVQVENREQKEDRRFSLLHMKDFLVFTSHIQRQTLWSQRVSVLVNLFTVRSVFQLMYVSFYKLV